VLSEKQQKTFDDFYNATRYNKTVDQKTTIMLHMSVAMALGCYP